MLATVEMVQARQRLLEDGRITESAYQYAVAHNFSDADIIGAVERVRLSRARLELQGSPLKYKAQPPLGNENDPTPEWVQKVSRQYLAKDAMGRGDVVPVRRYRIKPAIEQHGDKLEMSHKTALQRWLQDEDYAKHVKVADWNRAGGPGGGDRLGGLGLAPQRVRDGHARAQWVWRWLAPEMRRTARALVSMDLTKADGQQFSMEEFGALVLPAVIDKNRRWGVSAGLLLALADQLVELYRVCPIRARRIDDLERLEAAE